MQSNPLGLAGKVGTLAGVWHPPAPYELVHKADVHQLLVRLRNGTMTFALRVIGKASLEPLDGREKFMERANGSHPAVM